MKRACSIARSCTLRRAIEKLATTTQRTATDSSLRFVALCGEVHDPLDEEGGQVLQARIKPDTAIGQAEELHIVHLGTDSGVDVRVQSTMFPGKRVCVIACANEAGTADPQVQV